MQIHLKGVHKIQITHGYGIQNSSLKLTQKRFTYDLCRHLAA